MIFALLLAIGGQDVRICDKTNATRCATVAADGTLLVTTGAAGGGLTDAQLRASAVPVSVSGTFDVSDRVGRALGIVTIGAGSAAIGSITNTTFASTQGTSPWVTADNHTTAAAPLSLRLSDGAAFYTTNTGAQLPAALDGSGFLKVHEQGTATVSGTVTLGAGVAVVGHVIADTGSTTAVTGNVTVVQPTGTNLHAVIDTGSTTAVTQATAANLNATVVLAAGSALAGKVGIDQTTTGTTNGVTMVPSTASVAAVASRASVAVNTTTGIKASPGSVYGVSCANANASICWVQFYNSNTPTCGTASVWAVPMPSSGVINVNLGGLALANHSTAIGMCMGTTSTGLTACTTANACTIFYQ